MKLLLYKCNNIITCVPRNGRFKVGNELNEIGEIRNKSIIIDDGIITSITDKITDDDIFMYDEVIDCSEFTVLPGLIDSHTHLVFAGSRADEFGLRTMGHSYEEIVELGGGINKTVNATRKIDENELFSISRKRLLESIRLGITSIEIKSGYGLSLDSELKILRTIKRLKKEFSLDIYSTFLGAHTFPTEYKNDHQGYIKLLISELLPVVAGENLAEFCDIFVEKSAFSVDEAEKILDAANSFGLKIKIHGDQFNSMGAVPLARKYNAASIDHLEVIKENDIESLINSGISAIVLPGVSYFLNIEYAPIRKLIDKGIITVLATDFNPGSCMSQNLPLIMNIACTQMKMSINEAINSVTINAAYSLGSETKTGSIEPGKQGDFSILDTKNYQDLVYNFGTNHNKYTIKKGKIIYERNH